jgi:hypothetical protein
MKNKTKIVIGALICFLITLILAFVNCVYANQDNPDTDLVVLTIKKLEVLQTQYNQLSATSTPYDTETLTKIDNLKLQINTTQKELDDLIKSHPYYDELRILKPRLLGLNISLILLTVIIMVLYYFKIIYIIEALLLLAYFIILVFVFIDEHSLLSGYNNKKIKDISIPKLIFGIIAVILMVIRMFL